MCQLKEVVVVWELSDSLADLSTSVGALCTIIARTLGPWLRRREEAVVRDMAAALAVAGDAALAASEQLAAVAPCATAAAAARRSDRGRAEEEARVAIRRVPSSSLAPMEGDLDSLPRRGSWDQSYLASGRRAVSRSPVATTRVAAGGGLAAVRAATGGGDGAAATATPRRRPGSAAADSRCGVGASFSRVPGGFKVCSTI